MTMTQTTSARFRRRALALIGAFATVAALMIPTAAASASQSSMSSPAVGRAAGLSGSSFQPGNIISDSLFYQRGAMTAKQIQDFLDSKIGRCQNSNCLNVYMAKTEARSNDRDICTGYTPRREWGRCR